MKKNNILLVGIAVIVLVGAGVYFLMQNQPEEVRQPTQSPEGIEAGPPDSEGVGGEPINEPETVIGSSVQKRDITAYHYGSGDKELLFVGGIHGGYSWNTALLGYELMDYLKANPNVIPKNIRVTVIPVLNPDGLNKVTGTGATRFLATDVSTSKDTQRAGRFNANGVDLNRNFDCDWQAKGVWQNTPVSGGTKAFSEQESQALKAYVETHKPSAVIIWYSAVGGVFVSNCHNGVLSETRALTNAYAKASGYKAYESFDFYEITGDAANWIAKNNIPAISVLLTTHEDVEWNKNRAGIEALLKYYAE